ncbi:MAG: GLUG motif-containing protein, partial [Betaproteobacteria bacterium]
MPVSRRRHGRHPDRRDVLQPTLLSLALAACFPVNGIANPLDPSVVSGGAQFHQHGNTLTVTNTPGAVIEWRGFSVGADEVTRFAQHSAASAVLNRVIGPDPSQILGRLESNGQVFLINPNGILFGRNAVVDVGALVASTLPLSNADFAAGRLNFGHGGGAIDNQGQLHSVSGGRIFLVASDIRNHGIIQAPGGQILLAAGSRANLVDERRPDIQVSLTSPVGGEALNVGRLVAGQLGIYAAAIGNEGVVQATGAHVGANGEIVFRASRTLDVAPGGSVHADGPAGGSIRLEAADTLRVAGTVSAAGSAGTGGTVNLLGTKVSVLDGARIDVSGRDGGGRVMVLGDMASGVTTVAGTLLAEATGGGKGGFIETSAAKVSIAENARISTRSAQGDAGLWLIDPADFTIAASGGDITGTTLSSQLAGGNVEIQSTTGASGGMGDIHVNDAVSWSASTLTLTALRDININAVMTASGSSKLVLSPSTPIGAAPAIAGGGVKVGFDTSGNFKGRVDFPGRAGTGFLTIGGEGYMVINALGSPGSTTGTDLQGMRGNLGGRYALGANIDASATGTWNTGQGFAPVGLVTSPFGGKFNGLGHTVAGLTIARPVEDYVGLLGWTSGADIRNVGMTGGHISGRYHVGGLVGILYPGSVTNSYANGNVFGQAYVGGLAGSSYGGAVRNSYAGGTVTGQADRNGGLVGFNSSGTVSNSHATGSVSGASSTGGLVGWSASGTIADSYATGSVSGVFYTGGLVGYNSNGAVTNSYATGSVSGTLTTGGLVGYNDSSTVTNSYATGSVSGTGDFTGGLVGFNSATVTNSYATGSVSGVFYTGGLVGYQSSGTVTNSFWDTQTSGWATSA